jgi:hypothetical protein
MTGRQKGIRFLVLLAMVVLAAIAVIFALGGPLAAALVYASVPLAILAVLAVGVVIVAVAIRATDSDVGPRE